jgi:hypothetical protein
MHEVGVERLIASVAFVGTYPGLALGPLAVFPRFRCDLTQDFVSLS